MKRALSILATILIITSMFSVFAPNAHATPLNPAHHWAILISGGANAANNNARYWNDIGEMYDILISTCAYASTDIFVLYADGNQPSASNCGDYANARSYSAPINYAATEANIATVCTTIAGDPTATDSDTLFVFCTDHGSNNPVVLCLWGENMQPGVFADNNHIGKITKYSVRIFEMEQCFSGGFIPSLSAAKTIIATAVPADKESSGGIGTTFDPWCQEFNAAIKGKYPDGTTADADANQDGLVSVLEASNFAYNHKVPMDDPRYDDNGDGTGHTGVIPSGGDGDLGSHTFLTANDFHITASPEANLYERNAVTKTTVTVRSTRASKTTFWLGVSFKDPIGEVNKYDPQISWTPKYAALDSGASTTFSVSWAVPANAPTGYYKIAVNCWENVPFQNPSYKDDLDWSTIFFVYKLRILSPTTSAPADAGSPTNPSQIVVEADWIPSVLLDPLGMRMPTFYVEIGGKDGTYQLVSNFFVEYLLGKYTLKVNPPTQDSGGLYDLHVIATFDSIIDSDTQNSAVKYTIGGGGGVGTKIAYVYCSWGGWTMQDEISSLTSLDPKTYACDSYNENNINNLWTKLSDYKAILIDEDTFYSDWSWSSYGGTIYNSFRAHSTDLATFVNNGGGIFTSGENDLYRSQVWDWLPTGMQITSYDPESTSSVYICYDPGSPKGLYTYPNTITNSYLSGGHTHAWFTNWDTGYQVTIKRTDNNMPIELFGIFGKGCIVVSHVEAEAMYSAWQYLQNQLDFIVPPTQYNMIIASPSEGSVFKVGNIITFEAIIIDTNGNPGTGASVSVNLPDGTIMELNEVYPSSGVYQGTYEIAATDPTGPWPVAFLSSVGGEFPKITVPVLIPTDTNPPSIAVVTPRETLPEALQDGVILKATVTDPSGVSWVTFTIRQTDGTTIDPNFESMSATNVGGDTWQLLFNTYVPKLPDGYYLLIVDTSDTIGNQGSKTVLFSVRNWASLKLLPASTSNKAGRTMPIKFSLRVYETVDPAKPFVYNEELTIKIYQKGYPNKILQTSKFGTDSTNYRIDVTGELYITNFKTLNTPMTYTVEIWRKDLLIGTFEFKTVK